MPDILVLGATGVTGRQTAKYFLTHPDKDLFTWAIAGRSKSKLEALAKELSIPDSVPILQIAATNYDEVEKHVRDFKVVINLVGPYWKWGAIGVIKACVHHGVHYVDLTGETFFIKDIITEFDFLATKKGTLVVPSCGFDSVPADLSVWLAKETLNEHVSAEISIDTSVTAYSVYGGLSGGTAASMTSALTELPPQALHQSMTDYYISPVSGKPSPKPQVVASLHIPDTKKTLVGAYFVMMPSNRAIVQRTWGLLEHQALTESTPETRKARYGPDFKYNELLVMPNTIVASIVTLTLAAGQFAISNIPLFAWLFKQVIPKPGEGPSDEKMEKGWFKTTNITTTSPSAEHPHPIQIKTTIKAKGDPGYLLSPHMSAEAALCIVLQHKLLPPAGKKGGVLTPMVAFGDVFVERLKRTGRFELESFVVEDKKNV